MAAAGEDLLVLARIALVCCLVATAAGCGSTRDVTEDDTADTSRFELVLTRSDREGRLVMTGSLDYVGRRGSMTAKLVGTTDADDEIPTEARVFGDMYFVREERDGKAYWSVEHEDVGVGHPEEVIVPGAASRLDPREALGVILDAGDETVSGTEDVRGVRTTHYRVRLEPEALSRELGGRQLDDAAGPFTVDVWADDAGRMRRLQMVDETSTLTYDFFDFGIAVDVERPPTHEVVTTDASTETAVEPTPPSQAGQPGNKESE